MVKATAELERARVTADDAESKRKRTAELVERGLLPTNDLDNATLTRDTAVSQVRSADASVKLARASLSQAQVNLSKTVITSPIDGIVISRNVDVGQTVAASLSAPTLFLIAADLSQMQLNASIDESDMAKISRGQRVSFTVDAHPGETFSGTVEQVRLNPVVANNVVTYTTIISAPNAALQLKPGMTANLNIEVDRRDDVLRAPAAATRFKPNSDALKALNLPATEDLREYGVDLRGRQGVGRTGEVRRERRHVDRTGGCAVRGGDAADHPCSDWRRVGASDARAHWQSADGDAAASLIRCPLSEVRVLECPVFVDPAHS